MYRAYVILLGAQLAIGAAAIFARFALHGTGPVMASALRLTIAALPMLWLSWRNAKLSRQQELLLAGAGAALAIHFATWIASLLYTTVALSTLLVCTSPVWTALYDVVFGKRPARLRFWLAFLIAIGGVALTLQGPVASSFLGAALALTGGLAIGIYLIAVRSVTTEIPTTVIVGRTYSWAAACLIPAAFLIREAPPGADATAWGGILSMALVSQLIGHTGINASLRWFPSTTVAMTTLLEPIFAALLAAAVFHEHLGWNVLIGGTMVLASLVPILRE